VAGQRDLEAAAQGRAVQRGGDRPAQRLELESRFPGLIDALTAPADIRR
jgi:hypothetical protein